MSTVTKRHKSRTTSARRDKSSAMTTQAHPADAGVDGSQPGSPFFAKLNGDVRLVVYDYLYGSLPPLLAQKSEQQDCQGLVLSCKRANVELLEVAARHLKAWMNDFLTSLEETYERPFTLYQEITFRDGWKALRSIVIKTDVRLIYGEDVTFYDFLDWSSLPMIDQNHSSCYCLDIEVDEDSFDEIVLQDLLRKPFDKVTLLFACSNHNAIDREGNELHDLNSTGETDEDGVDDYNEDDFASDSESDSHYSMGHDSDSSADEEKRAELRNVLGHIQFMHGRLVKSICYEWLGHIAIDDRRSIERYEERPSLVQPHDCQGLPFDDPSACQACRKDCARHWRCMSLWESYQCDGLDSGCAQFHDFVGGAYTRRKCKNQLADDAFHPGPKKAAYKTREQYELAFTQWKRITDSPMNDVAFRESTDGGYRGAGQPMCFCRPHGGGDANEDYDKIPIEDERIKEIVFAWDFRTSTEPVRGGLKGKAFRYHQSHTGYLAKCCQMQIPKTIRKYDERWPSRTFLDSEDGMVGLMGYKHPKRWAMAHLEEVMDEEYLVGALITSLETDEGTSKEVTSQGIGMPIVPKRSSKRTR